MKFIDLGLQYRRVQPAIDSAIKKVLDHGAYVNGPEVAEFEHKLAEFVGVPYAIGVANGTDALMLALMALGIGSGHAVIVPAFTFFATAEAVSLVGAVPVFADIDETSFNIDPKSIEETIARESSSASLDVKAIITVDLFGLPADYDAISAVASKHELKLIEDAAQGLGGAISGRKACSFGDIATTSFFPAKPLGCYGDGGAVLTADGSLAELVRSLREHGQGSNKYENLHIGMNSRLDSIQAAVLLGKLNVFEDELERRDEIASNYSNRLSEAFVVPAVLPPFRSAWAQYTVRPRSKDRSYYQDQLKQNGIPTAVYYNKPLHLQPAFAHLGNEHGLCPVAEKLSDEVFSLPMHPYLEPEQVESIATAMLK